MSSHNYTAIVTSPDVTGPGIYCDGTRIIELVPIKCYPLRVFFHGGYYDVKDFFDGKVEWGLLKPYPLPEWWGNPEFMN